MTVKPQGKNQRGEKRIRVDQLEMPSKRQKKDQIFRFLDLPGGKWNMQPRGGTDCANPFQNYKIASTSSRWRRPGDHGLFSLITHRIDMNHVVTSQKPSISRPNTSSHSLASLKHAPKFALNSGDGGWRTIGSPFASLIDTSPCFYEILQERIENDSKPTLTLPAALKSGFGRVS
jgi:hypothetical protein